MKEKLTNLIEASGMVEGRSRCEIIAEELLANGVIVLPCKVGDTVYYLDDAEVVKDKVIGVVYSDDMDYLTKSVRTYDCLLAWENFGKTYFATKEEAEKALERSGE